MNRATTQLRQMIDGDGIVVAPGVFDGMSARLGAMSGFSALYMTGGGVARSTGVPDLGLLTATEVVNRATEIVEASGIPVIADADTGFGNALNARKVAREFERAGVAGFHLEDQTFPKRCGHYNDKAVVPAREFAQKIAAVRDVLHDNDFVIIARTDALAVEGMEAAIERSAMYIEAGADVAFVEAPTTLDEIREIAARIPAPKLINMFHGGKTPLVPVDVLSSLGYRIVIIPGDVQRAAIRAMKEVFEEIRDHGDSGRLVDRMATYREREELVNTDEFLRIEKKFGV